MTRTLFVDWSKSMPWKGLSHNMQGEPIWGNFCPVVSGPKGGKVKLYDAMYADGTLPAHYPVPALRNPLNVIAAMPCGPVTDFIDLGYYGKYWK